MSNVLLNAVWPLQMPVSQKFVLIALAEFANDDGECWPSLAYLCEHTCMTDRGVQKALAALVDAGWLTRTFRMGHSTQYVVTPERGSPPNDVHPERGSPDPRTTFTTAPERGSGTPERGSPRTINNHQLNHQGTTTNTRDMQIDSSDSFAEFWQAYPRKTAKTMAMKAWKKLKPDAAVLAKMLEALQAQKTSPQWTKDGGQYIPHASTWLNQCRWEDETSERSSQAGQPIAYDLSVADVIAGALRNAA